MRGSTSTATSDEVTRVAQPWHRLAAALVAAGWGANQFAPMLLVYRALAIAAVASSRALA